MRLRSSKSSCVSRQASKADDVGQFFAIYAEVKQPTLSTSSETDSGCDVKYIMVAVSANQAALESPRQSADLIQTRRAKLAKMECRRNLAKETLWPVPYFATCAQVE